MGGSVCGRGEAAWAGAWCSRGGGGARCIKHEGMWGAGRCRPYEHEQRS